MGPSATCGMAFRFCFSPRPAEEAGYLARPLSFLRATVRTISSSHRWAVLHEHPWWYENLLLAPDADIQVKSEHLAVTARTASDEEKPGLWKIVADQWPNYHTYQTRTERVIPVVVLSPR